MFDVRNFYFCILDCLDLKIRDSIDSDLIDHIRRSNLKIVFRGQDPRPLFSLADKFFSLVLNFLDYYNLKFEYF